MPDSHALSSDQLHSASDPSSLGFKTTDDLEPLSGALGQQDAMDALEFGISVPSPGYNIFVLGRNGSGRQTFIRQALRSRAANEPTPPDWCYVFNFRDARCPKILQLPSGRSTVLKRYLERLVEDLKKAIPLALEADDVITARSVLFEERGRIAEQELQAFRQETEDDEKVVLIGEGIDGLMVVPAHGGEPLKKEAYVELPEEVREGIDEAVREGRKRLFQVQRRVHELQQEARDQAAELHQEVTRSVVEHRVSFLKDRFEESEGVIAHLEAIGEDVVENWEKFIRTQPKGSEAEDGAGELFAEDFFSRYQINTLVCHERNKGAPVIEEAIPNLRNLLGQVEGEVRFGVMVTDFTHIAPGSVHRANGGYLIIPANELVSRPSAWANLKRTLSTRELRPADPVGEMGYQMIEKLEPEPIPMDLKVIIIGEPSLYYTLQQVDQDFEELFKVKVDFTPHMDRTPDTERGYGEFVAARCVQDSLPPFDASAVARIIEEGSRLAGDQKKLTTRFGEITDLVREAAHQAPEAPDTGQGVVTSKDVDAALRERNRRNNRPHREILELIERGVLSFEPHGEVVGQLHGIGLIQISDDAFGRPIRVMSSAYLGTEGVINIEREARMSGRIHSKGFLVLSGYFGKHFAQSTPLIFSANISFDQLYEEVEGDSASVAELFALMSAVSGIPLRQDLAVTGALNQEGFVLPVGGVTEKVEGVFQACKRMGLTGSQGVILPRRNVENLVLRSEIRDAVDEGQFHIYAIDRVEEGWPILTGREAGEIQEDGSFPAGTVHRAVMDQLAKWVDDWRGDGEDTTEGKEEEGETSEAEGVAR